MTQSRNFVTIHSAKTFTALKLIVTLYLYYYPASGGQEPGMRQQEAVIVVGEADREGAKGAGTL